uniref:NADH dehydrogenase subunit 4L n=1 Tax=Stephalia dilata TaxID=316222 RepID=UPI0026E2520D|nr:NADH dehydrogenase subunit 4L [Stephalia dilata]WJJ69996.1 NADH dehydrogenase subunit 4L [Stephalia dilata]
MIFSLYSLPFIMFILSIIGIILNRSSIILILICIEIMLLSISLNFILYSLLLKTILGQIYSLYIITVAAVESAIGLSIMISFYKLKGSISIKFLNLLRG